MSTLTYHNSVNNNCTNKLLQTKTFVEDVPKIDPDGHGTAVAGVAMSDKYGVAKSGRALAVGVGDTKGKIHSE